MSHNVYRGGKVHVLREQCSTCIFRPGNLMRLSPGRVKEMVADSLKNESAIICHSTLDGDNAVCRGFFDAYGEASMTLRTAMAFNCIAEVDPPKQSSTEGTDMAMKAQEPTKAQQVAIDRIAKSQERVEAAEEKLALAVEKAREKEVTWKHIADALGVAQGTAYRRYANSTE